MWSSCHCILSFCSRQLACEIRWLQCQERLGLGTSLWPRGASDRHATLHSRQEDKWGFTSQLAKPAPQRLTTALPTSGRFFSQHLPRYSSFHFTFTSRQPLSSVTLKHYSNEPGTVCKVAIFSQNLSIYSGQWDVICMHSNKHISVFFRESFTVKPSLHLVVFNCYHGRSITLHMGMLPQMKQKKKLLF